MMSKLTVEINFSESIPDNEESEIENNLVELIYDEFLHYIEHYPSAEVKSFWKEEE